MQSKGEGSAGEQSQKDDNTGEDEEQAIQEVWETFDQGEQIPEVGKEIIGGMMDKG